jgi:hypothetical protein
MRHQMRGWEVGPLVEWQREVFGAVVAGAGVVAVLEDRCGGISLSGRSMHPISGGGGRRIAGGDSRGLSTLGTVSAMVPPMRVVLAWGNGYYGLSG